MALPPVSRQAHDPYHVTFYHGGLYLVGHCHLRRDVRILAVERIRTVSALPETFVKRPTSTSTVPCPEGRVRVTFLTQMRLKHTGAFARGPDFQVLFRRLLGRLSVVARFHGPGPPDVDFRGLIEADAAAFWPYLVFGPWTHVGSGTTFGLGRYRIEPTTSGGCGRSWGWTGRGEAVFCCDLL